MPQFLQMNPVTRDYVVRNGSPIETDDIRQRGYMALTIPKNNWLYGQTSQGSLLYRLNQVKRTALIEQQFSSYVQDAVQQNLITPGYATAVGVKNIATSPTGTSNQVSVVPTTTPIQSNFNFVSV
jgi:phage gp46-like protein